MLTCGRRGSLDAITSVAAAAPASEAESNVLDFDIGDFSVPEVKPAAAEIETPAEEFEATALPEMTEVLEMPAVTSTEKEMLDFDFQLDAPVADPQAAPALSLDDVDLSLELPPLEETPEATPQAAVDLGLDDTDPMSTKIDLARAYLDMGDKEGAREILLEVVQDGSADHQNVAKQLLEQL